MSELEWQVLQAKSIIVIIIMKGVGGLGLFTELTF